MIKETTSIDGLLILKPKLFSDERGYFYESYNKNTFQKMGLNLNFFQDNESSSKKNVLRGLHFQNPPYEQGKLVRVLKGSVLDIAVDIRKNSKTYGQYEKIILSEENKLMFWIPPGFAHGFLTLEDDTVFSYKCTNFYNKASEGTLKWNDPVLNINWNTKTPFISKKDNKGVSFGQFQSKF